MYHLLVDKIRSQQMVLENMHPGFWRYGWYHWGAGHCFGVPRAPGRSGMGGEHGTCRPVPAEGHVLVLVLV